MLEVLKITNIYQEKHILEEKVNFKIFLYLLLLKTGKRKISKCIVRNELKFCIHVEKKHNFIVTWAFLLKWSSFFRAP